MNDQDAYSIKMFEYLELRSSVLLTDINGLLTQLREVDGTGLEWRMICAELKSKQDELEAVFERIRVEIESASSELTAKEFMLKHLEDTIEPYMHN